MRTIALILIPMTALVACDVTESPGEEAREAVEAIGDGEPLEEVGREAGQIGDAVKQDVEEATEELKSED